MLTAHPTEIVRRTLLQKYDRIARALAEKDRPDLTVWEREHVVGTLRARDRRQLGDRRDPPGAAHPARRGARRPAGLRADAVAGAAALSARAGSRARATHRRGLPVDDVADPLRHLDRRRSRRQPERHPRRDAAGVPSRPLDGRRPLLPRGRSAAQRAVAGQRQRRAAGPRRRRRARALSRDAARRARRACWRRASWAEAMLDDRRTSAPPARSRPAPGRRSTSRSRRSPSRCACASDRCARPATP